jgi:hypothetical protein
MPYQLEKSSGGHSFNGMAIVVNTKSNKHYSAIPIPIKKAKAQKRVLEAAEKKEKQK